MKKVIAAALVSLLFAFSAHAQTAFPLFQPADGIMVGDVNTYVTTSAAASDVISLWSGSCSPTTLLRGDGSCGIASVAAGGTGATSLSGVLRGNGTSPLSAAASADVISLWGGTCNSTSFLRGDGSCVFASTAVGANPTAQVGTSAVNGAATTFMRSDAAPAIDQNISPTWTGTHTFSITPVVPNQSWTYAKIQNVSATSRFLGRITGGAGTIEELTGTQSTTLLDVFTSGLKGLAPASGGGTTNFLRADGTWAAAGGGTPGGSDTAVQFNDGGVFGGQSTLFSFDKTTNNVSVGSTASTGIVQGRTNPSTGTGGALRVAGGDGGSNGQGGALTLRGGLGNGAGNNGGNTNLSGALAADGNGGNVNILGAAGTGTSRGGSPITISGGDSTNAVTGGAVTVDSGRGGPTGAGGVLTLTAGQGGTTSGNGALATLRGGSGGGSGNGGGVAITGRNGTGTATTGGAVDITAGNGTTSGAAGNVTITAGSSPSGTDGSVSIATNASSTRITIDGDGSWDLAGTTPGTSGQVFTSNGASAAPTWQDDAITTTSGTFTGTSTGCTTNCGTYTLSSWSKTGSIGCIQMMNGGSGTSNATTFTITGIPSQIQPVLSGASVSGVVEIVDNGTTKYGTWFIATGTLGTLVLSNGPLTAGSATAFTNSGTKGLGAGFAACWRVTP